MGFECPTQSLPVLETHGAHIFDYVPEEVMVGGSLCYAQLLLKRTIVIFTLCRFAESWVLVPCTGLARSRSCRHVIYQDAHTESNEFPMHMRKLNIDALRYAQDLLGSFFYIASTMESNFEDRKSFEQEDITRRHFNLGAFHTHLHTRLLTADEL